MTTEQLKKHRTVRSLFCDSFGRFRLQDRVAEAVFQGHHSAALSPIPWMNLWCFSFCKISPMPSPIEYFLVYFPTLLIFLIAWPPFLFFFLFIFFLFIFF